MKRQKPQIKVLSNLEKELIPGKKNSQTHFIRFISRNTCLNLSISSNLCSFQRVLWRQYGVRRRVALGQMLRTNVCTTLLHVH